MQILTLVCLKTSRCNTSLEAGKEAREEPSCAGSKGCDGMRSKAAAGRPASQSRLERLVYGVVCCAQGPTGGLPWATAAHLRQSSGTNGATGFGAISGDAPDCMGWSTYSETPDPNMTCKPTCDLQSMAFEGVSKAC
jgi:hypothetical protein